MSANVPATPHSVVDTHMDGASALTIAEEVIVTPRRLTSMLGLYGIVAQVTARHQTGFSYSTRFGATMANDGYVAAYDDGHGGTRVCFHENKRYLMIVGIVGAILVIGAVILFATLVPRSYGSGSYGMNVRPGSSGLIWTMVLIMVVTFGLVALQVAEFARMPRKVAQDFAQRVHGFLHG
jgi:hypothetical protein